VCVYSGVVSPSDYGVAVPPLAALPVLSWELVGLAAIFCPGLLFAWNNGFDTSISPACKRENATTLNEESITHSVTESLIELVTQYPSRLSHCTSITRGSSDKMKFPEFE